jgi:hypothetical protein
MWDLERIQRNITDKVEEDLHLDYKGAGSLASTDGKKAEIAKDVSAFANSDGGTILYGVLEFQDPQKSHLPEKIDAVDRNVFSKETLENIINSRISPKIHGIKITPITIGDEKDNKVVYAVEIPKGTTAHQSSDKRYYRRLNFQSVMMDDWEIKDVINRTTVTNVEVLFRFAHGEKYFEQFKARPGYKFQFDIIALNDGNKVCSYLDVFIVGNKKSSQYIIPNPKMDGDLFELAYYNEVEHKATIEDSTFTINVQRIPIGPKTYRQIGTISIMSEFFVDNSGLQITVSTDDNRTSNFVNADNFELFY